MNKDRRGDLKYKELNNKQTNKSRISNIRPTAVPGQSRENQDEEIVKEMAALPPKTPQN